jgi:hypothetical protein
MILTTSPNNGGKAILQDQFDINRVSEPLTQFRLLSRILGSQTEIKPAEYSVQRVQMKWEVKGVKRSR